MEEEGGGELGGSNWGVIEVTKRVERNIPGIPGHSSDHLPYLPTLGPAGFLLLHEIFFSLDTLSHEVILATSHAGWDIIICKQSKHVVCS